MTSFNQTFRPLTNLSAQLTTQFCKTKPQARQLRLKKLDLTAIAGTGLSTGLALLLQEGLFAIPGFALVLGLNTLNRRQDMNELCQRLTQGTPQLERLTTTIQEITASTRDMQTTLEEKLKLSENVIGTQKLAGRGRVCILVDEANISFPVLSQRKRLKYQAILDILTQDASSLDKAMIFLGKDPGNDRQRRFRHRLTDLGFSLITKDTIHRQDGTSKANFDIEITLQMLQRLPHYDTLILVSGDGDFAAALQHIQSLGRRVEVVSWKEQTSHCLRSVADQFTELDSIVDQIIQ